MGRTRTFDEAAVLDGAMMTFREHGFAGASVRDLERATGLSAGSLYNAFGDKEGLYRAAFGHYFRLVIEPRLGAAVTLDEVEAAYLGLFEPPMTDGFGCLVINGVIEFGGQGSAPAADLIARGLDIVDQSLERVLAHELGPAAGHAARRLALIYQGLLVVSRSGRPIAPYRPAVIEEFDRLRALRPTTTKP
ncbi:TetR/AcrR family transcriptional regulator [Phenylobacterium sp.]|uniref:TetR/AcrR family transcriptional regulator n=1 Tax=Phenylobacterium sp. TaxID=1871053 RepID=UPI00286AB851|nr:TetR/AcrR family transcriptional regulator [Phenylobacterium sp.]